MRVLDVGAREQERISVGDVAEVARVRRVGVQEIPASVLDVRVHVVAARLSAGRDQLHNVDERALHLMTTDGLPDGR